MPAQRQVDAGSWQTSAQPASVPPSAEQVTSQVVVPLQSQLAPGASVNVQSLPPPQVTVEPAPAEIAQLLVPSQVTVEPAPTETSPASPPPQLLWPVQLYEQFAPQEPEQLVWAPHVALQPEPQARLHSFWAPQLKVTSDGSPASVPPEPPSAGPREQDCPLWQLQLPASSQLQAPVQAKPVTPITGL